MQVDVARREITLKFVYYGPALSGKTTNLQALHRVMPGEATGRLMSLETRDDRTLFFDLLPLRVEATGGLKIKLKLYTVPGQVFHNATRRLVLQAADGVAFVADSRRSEIASNAESFQNLAENLHLNGLDLRKLPLVIQFNKRDLPEIRPDQELDELARHGREPVFKAVAKDGKGVIETFLGLLQLTWSRLQDEHHFEQRFGVDSKQLLTSITSLLGLPKGLVRDRHDSRPPGGARGG